MIDGSRLQWPLFTLDFEASGLGELTYPIEIGVAKWSAPEAPIEIWSSLIKPTPDWVKHRIWSTKSEAVHGIRKEELAMGVSACVAVEQANRIIGANAAMCDGGEHDARWLLHLAHAAGHKPSFRLANWAGFVRLLPRDRWSVVTDWLRSQPVPHRAAADAERLMRGLAAGLGQQPASKIWNP